MALNLASMFNTLPNNRDQAPMLIESKQHLPAPLNEQLKTSNFSNFSNYKAMLDAQNRERSKYFDLYYPADKRTDREHGSTCDSLSSSQSSSTEPKSENDATKPDDLVQNFDLHTNPVRFDLDRVNYVKTLSKAKSIVEIISKRSKVIAINCDSDCCLQNGVDLLEVAVTFDESLDHPEIYVFDIHLTPGIIDLFKPVFADAKIVKVMFDARFDLRILCRKYGVTEFAALFDIQLAYRVLLAKLTDRPFAQTKREKLLYVSWQCNGPLVNIEKMYLPGVYYFKNRKFWQTRPINLEIMYNAAYDVFVMVPQLFTNLLVIMERTLGDEHQQLFIKESNDLIARNLVERQFTFFYTKHEYLGEMHRQIDLLIQSDILHRNKQLAKWQRQLIDQDYESTYADDCFDASNDELLKNQINDIDTDSYRSYASEDLMDSADYYWMVNEDLVRSRNSMNRPLDESVDESVHQTNELNNSESGSQQTRYCEMCKLMIKNAKLSELLNNLEQSDRDLKELLFTAPNYCQCIQLRCSDEEVKCMNLLVDQIIDLAECKEDYMELDE